ncbi:MAG: DUF5667 domain-containing protein [Methanoregulaceae archaeon]
MATDLRFLNYLLMACAIGAFLAVIISPVAADTDDSTTQIGNLTPPPDNNQSLAQMHQRAIPNSSWNNTTANLTGNESFNMTADYWRLPPLDLNGNESEYNLTFPEGTLPNETIGPDNPVYSLKLMFEKVNEALTTNNTERLQLRLQHAESRLAEANTAILNDKSDTAQTALDNYNDEIASAKEMLAELPENSKELTETQKTIEKLQQILDQLTKKLEKMSDKNADSTDSAKTGANATSRNGNGPMTSIRGDEAGSAMNGTYSGNFTAPQGDGNRTFPGMGNMTGTHSNAGNMTERAGPGNQGAQGTGNGITNSTGPNPNGQQNGEQSQKSSGSSNQGVTGGRVSGGQSNQGAPQQGQQGRAGGDNRNPAQNSNSGRR